MDIVAHTYNSIRRDLNLSYPDQTAVRAASPANDEEVLLVTAHADLGQVTGGFDTLLRRPSGLSLTVLPPASAVHLQLLDSSDVLLADYALNPLTHADAESPAEEEIVTIAETVTYLTGTAQLRLQVAGKTVASVTVSANSPTVTLLSPNGGEWLNNEAVVTWSASDPDGDDLIYTLLHSADGGGSWHALAVGWPQTSYTLTTEYLPGSTDTYFQVIASDGVNTGQDTGDGPATIPFRPPQVQIATPLDGSTLNSVQSVLLTAEARDPDQKPISDDGYGWTSDLDGALGTGRSVTIWALSPGIHQVTVSVTDADG